MLLLLFALLAGRDALAGAPGGSLAAWRIERDVRRFRTVATDNVMKLLAIRPGMTILDIGAGTGQFAYEFARILNGTGKVYATETNEACVDYMNRESDRRGLRNLRPVLVAKDGVDAFYGKDRYDLITIFHVSMAYENRVGYLRDLRAVLADAGRLVLILYKIPTPFSRGDFTGDFRGFIKELLLEPAESPYYRLLKDSTRKMIREHPGANPPEELMGVVAGDFNEVLGDTRFAPQIVNGSFAGTDAQFLPGERGYADWALPPAPEPGSRTVGSSPQRAPIDGRFSTINKLLIVRKYRRFLKGEGLFGSGFTPPIRAAFEKAGYRLEREYGDVIPFEDIVIFAPR